MLKGPPGSRPIVGGLGDILVLWHPYSGQWLMVIWAGFLLEGSPAWRHVSQGISRDLVAGPGAGDFGPGKL